MFPWDHCTFKGKTIEDVKDHFKTMHTGSYRMRCAKEVKTMTKWPSWKRRIYYTDWKFPDLYLK